MLLSYWTWMTSMKVVLLMINLFITFIQHWCPCLLNYVALWIYFQSWLLSKRFTEYNYIQGCYLQYFSSTLLPVMFQWFLTHCTTTACFDVSESSLSDHYKVYRVVHDSWHRQVLCWFVNTNLTARQLPPSVRRSLVRIDFVLVVIYRQFCILSG